MPTAEQGGSTWACGRHRECLTRRPGIRDGWLSARLLPTPLGHQPGDAAARRLAGARWWPVRVLEFSSTLAASRQVVWSVVSTMSGVNDELGPWVRMTHPDDPVSFAEAVPGRRVFRSWVLFLGLVPLDRHSLVFDRVDDGHGFVEESASWLQRRWRHERELADHVDGGCVVTDRLVFEPRFAVSGPMVGVMIRRVFVHRHRQLRRRFGTQ